LPNATLDPVADTAAYPPQGMHGIVFDASEGVPPAAAVILRTLNLRRPGPLASPRLWAALHDAVLYSDPRAASGGKVRGRAAALARRLPAQWCRGASCHPDSS
jgi:hypothetical protein